VGRAGNSPDNVGFVRLLRPRQQIASATQESIGFIAVIRTGLGDPEGELCFGFLVLQLGEKALAVLFGLLGNAATKNHTELIATNATQNIRVARNRPESMTHRHQ
jgi:hypothetical protein